MPLHPCSSAARLREHISIEEEAKVACHATDVPAITCVQVEKITLVRTSIEFRERSDNRETAFFVHVHHSDQAAVSRAASHWKLNLFH
jgi:hypothetical protein